MRFQRARSAVCFKTRAGEAGKILRRNADFAKHVIVLGLFKGPA
jgi:hypothetical protein